MRTISILFCALVFAASPGQAGAPSNKQIAWRFAESVKAGGDITLEGRVPVSDRQRVELGHLVGCDFRQMPVSNAKRSIFLWTCPKGRVGDDYLTDVHFNGSQVVRLEVSVAIRRPV